MAISRITSNGRVTIPKRIREELHLRKGDRLDFRIEQDGSLRVYRTAKKASEVFGAFAHKSKKPLTAAQTKMRFEKAVTEQDSGYRRLQSRRDGRV